MNSVQLNNITHNNLPEAVEFLIKETAENKKLLLELLHEKSIEKPSPIGDKWMSINELCAYHPDKPQRSTVYNWIYKNEIPVHKGAKRVRFLRSEIDLWLQTKRRKTNGELIEEAPGKLLTKKG